MGKKIFVNYRREDDANGAARVRDALAANFGNANVFMDVDNLLAGQRFDQELTKALAQCDVLIAVIGPRWMELLQARAASSERDYVREEICEALKRKLTVIPVRVGREGQLAPLPPRERLPEDIRDLVLYQKHDVAHERFRGDADALIAAIRAGRRALQPTTREDGIASHWLIGAGAIGAGAAIALGLYVWSGTPPVPIAQVSPPTPTKAESAPVEVQSTSIAELEARIKNEETARAKAEDEAKRLAELAAKATYDLDSRLKAEAETRRQAEETERRRVAAAKAAENQKRAEAELSRPGANISSGAITIPKGVFYAGLGPTQYLAKTMLISQPVLDSAGTRIAVVKDIIFDIRDLVVDGLLIGALGKEFRLRIAAVRFETQDGKARLTGPSLTKELLVALAAGQFDSLPRGVLYATLGPTQFDAGTKLINQPVVDQVGTRIAVVSDIILSTKDNIIDGVIVGVGGALGIGQKKIGVRYGALKFEQKDGKTVISIPTATREILDTLPPYRGATQD